MCGEICGNEADLDPPIHNTLRDPLQFCGYDKMTWPMQLWEREDFFGLQFESAVHH